MKQQRATKIKRPPIQTLRRLSKKYHDIGASSAAIALTPEQQDIYNGRGQTKLAWSMYGMIQYVELLEQFKALAEYMAANWEGISAQENGICHFCGTDNYGGGDCEHDPGCVVLLMRDLEGRLAR